jgi:NitT/TauT family transport system permease protein
MAPMPGLLDGPSQTSSDRTDTGRTRRYAPLVRSLLIQWGIVAVAVGAWAAVTASGLVSGVLLPPVGSTASALGQLLTSSTGLHNLGVTGLELLGAFGLSAPVGIALGFVLGEIKFRRRHEAIGSTADNLLSTLLATPKFVFLPVLIVILGVSYWEKVVYALGDGLIVVIIGTAAASYTADQQVRLVSRALRMNKWQFFWKVYLPGALPVLVEALRLSLILTISGVLLAELYISNAGIGYLIFQWGTNFQLPQLFAGVILVALLAIVINTIFRVVEARMNRWRTSRQV